LAAVHTEGDAAEDSRKEEKGKTPDVGHSSSHLLGEAFSPAAAERTVELSVGSIRGEALIVWLESLIWLETLVVVGLEALVPLVRLESLISLLETLVCLGIGLIGREVRLLEYLILRRVALRVIGRDCVRWLKVVGAGRGRRRLGEEWLGGEIRIWVVAVAHDLIIIVRFITGFTAQS
jgi:hypothetical protein